MEKKSIVFVTHNEGKVASANKYFENTILFEVAKREVEEIRGTLEEIAKDKVVKAFSFSNGKPTIAVDAGFFIEEYKGFPGPYTNFSLEKLGVDGILHMMTGKENRKCCFKQVLAYHDGTLKEPILFYGIHRGNISTEKRGKISSDDWSELSYIFIPDGYNQTLGEMTHEQRVKLAQRDDSESAFRAFKKWCEKESEKRNKYFFDFYEAYHFLEKHPIFEGEYEEELYMEVVKVNPKTKSVDNDKSLNIETEIWFEIGPRGYHDLDLDTGGATYEEATINLANLVYSKYGEGGGK